MTIGLFSQTTRLALAIAAVLCALAMGLSDLVVIGNALRLLRWELFSFRKLRRRLAYDLEIPDLMDQG